MIINILVAVLTSIAMEKTFWHDLDRALAKRRKIIAIDDEIGIVFSHHTISGRYLIRYLDSNKDDIGFDLSFDFETHEDASRYYNEFLRIEKRED